MRCLLIFLLVQGVLSVGDFYSSYFARDHSLCHSWTCMLNHLNLEDPVKSKEGFQDSLKKVLPDYWHETVPRIAEKCSTSDKAYKYTHACPGQALLHCVIDNMIDNCPEQVFRKFDSCAPVTSVAGFKHMFSQSRYENLEKYIPTERRPVWFLQHYFSSKCCNLPQFVNKTVLNECGFDAVIHYYSHEPKPKYNFKPFIPPKEKKIEIETNDPLDCCDITDFVPKKSRTDCNFVTGWDKESRITIRETESKPVPVTSTTTVRPESKVHYIKVVPASCESTTCVFKKLNVLTENSLNKDNFIKILDQFTLRHPEWSKAKGPVITSCLQRPLTHVYDGVCDINKLLSCTFDVLSENCPHAKKFMDDPCKHFRSPQNDTICQISSSVYRPKNRRLHCDFPSLVDHTVLQECNLNSLSKIISVQESNQKVKKPHWLQRGNTCNDLNPSTTCVLDKMSVLTKYKFMDYFKTKERINEFLEKSVEWTGFKDYLLGIFITPPMYENHCTSPRKFLNVLDTILMTCPISKRKNTVFCNRVFSELQNVTVIPSPKVDISTTTSRVSTEPSIKESQKHMPKKFLHQNSGHYFFSGDKMPPVKIIKIKPQKMKKEKHEPLVLLPVYKRMTTDDPVLIRDPIGPTTVKYTTPSGLFIEDNRLGYGPTTSRPWERPPYYSPIWRENNRDGKGFEVLRPNFERPFTNAHSGGPDIDFARPE